MFLLVSDLRGITARMVARNWIHLWVRGPTVSRSVAHIELKFSCYATC